MPPAPHRKFLKEEEKRGSFEIFNPDLKKSFWNYYLDESTRVFTPDEMTKEIMAKPRWRMKPSSAE